MDHVAHSDELKELAVVVVVELWVVDMEDMMLVIMGK